jgi:hypothetical protein
MGTRDVLNAVAKRKYLRPCRESNPLSMMYSERKDGGSILPDPQDYSYVSSC